MYFSNFNAKYLYIEKINAYYDETPLGLLYA